MYPNPDKILDYMDCHSFGSTFDPYSSKIVSLVKSWKRKNSKSSRSSKQAKMFE